MEAAAAERSAISRPAQAVDHTLRRCELPMHTPACMHTLSCPHELPVHTHVVRTRFELELRRIHARVPRRQLHDVHIVQQRGLVKLFVLRLKLEDEGAAGELVFEGCSGSGKGREGGRGQGGARRRCR